MSTFRKTVSLILVTRQEFNVVSQRHTFHTSVVTILSKTCNAENVDGLFTILVLAAFFMQYLRQSIAWQQTQLQRCTLMTPKTKRKSPCWYHLLTLASSVLYLLSISFILTQNIYVNISITVGNLLCEHIVLSYAESDAEKCKKNNDEENDETKELDISPLVPNAGNSIVF